MLILSENTKWNLRNIEQQTTHILLVLFFFPILLTVYTFYPNGKIKTDSKQIIDLSRSNMDANSVRTLSCFPFDTIKDQIIVTHKSDRPDASTDWLTFETIHDRTVVNATIGTPIYLTAKNGYIQFTTEWTPLSIAIQRQEAGLKLMMELKIFDESGEVLIHERNMDPLPTNQAVNSVEQITQTHLKEGVTKLINSRWVGPNLLYANQTIQARIAAIKEDRAIPMNHNRIIVDSDSILEAHKGAQYIYENGKWIKSNQTKGKILALIEEIANNEIQWKVWSENGIESIQFSSHRAINPENLLPNDSGILSIKKQSLQFVTCSFKNGGKQLVKKGDILTWRTKNGKHRWSLVEDKQELVSLLRPDYAEPVLIVDTTAPLFEATLFSSFSSQTNTITHCLDNKASFQQISRKNQALSPSTT